MRDAIRGLGTIFLIIIVISVFSVFRDDKPKEPQKQEEVVEVQKEPTSYIVEVDDLQTQLLDEMNLAELEGLKNGNTYEVPNEDKDKILKSLDMWLDADCLEILADNDYLDNVCHSKDYQLFRIYFSDSSQKDTFLTFYAKRLFELGLIYNKFNGNDTWIFIKLYDEKGNGFQTIDSDMLGL